MARNKTSIRNSLQGFHKTSRRRISTRNYTHDIEVDSRKSFERIRKTMNFQQCQSSAIQKVALQIQQHKLAERRDRCERAVFYRWLLCFRRTSYFLREHHDFQLNPRKIEKVLNSNSNILMGVQITFVCESNVKATKAIVDVEANENDRVRWIWFLVMAIAINRQMKDDGLPGTAEFSSFVRDLKGDRCDSLY